MENATDQPHGDTADRECVWCCFVVSYYLLYIRFYACLDTYTVCKISM